MPLYEYQCQECDTRFERIERASEMHDGVCPACGGAARRLIGAPALKFKGSGWYVTDYGKGHAAGPAATESSTDSGTSTTEKKTEPTAKESTAKQKSADTSASSKVA